MGILGYLQNIISNNNRKFKICDKGDDTPAPTTVKIRFPLYSGWCADGTFRVVREYHSNNNRWFKICDKGDDTPVPSPESKNSAFLYYKPQLKFDFRFIPAGAQMGLSGTVREHHKPQ
nr:unnamed protein product [Callosobruchus analis]